MTFIPNYFGGPPGQYDAEAEFYGKDLFFDGDLRVGPNGDYLTVDGVENLRRAILRRLIVRPGEYRLRPNYGAGLGAFVKKPMTSTLRSELTKRVRAQVLQDRRISRLLEVTVSRIVINGVPAIEVFVRAESFGRRLEFRPRISQEV